MQDNQNKEVEETNKEVITVYYDGECWFCQHYARYLGLFKKYAIQLRNAREFGEEMEQFHQQGFDINKGMIVEYQDNIFHGAEAVLLLNTLMQGKVYQQNKPHILSPFIKRGYKGLNSIRKMILLLQGKTKIH